jgi:peptidoglycan hydrolase-like protein with peptidoglycan-binding domain|tara:strand:- start:152 stop:1021 length:870 start_codon:yes stop_codon:yes gene_type:complete
MILKLGSRGTEVQELQEFLGIVADGTFGQETLKVVKKWQTLQQLKPDGIVGPATWNAMELASTDEYENFLKLPINRYYLPEGEYYTGPTDKEYLFLHHTGGWHNPYKTVDNWGADSRGLIGTEFLIGGQSVRGNNSKYDGEIIKAFPDGGYGWHLGKNGSRYMHKHSVGVEVNNFGFLVDGKTYAGTRVEQMQTVTLAQPFRGHRQWHRYSNEQIKSLEKLAKHIGERDSIDIRKGLPELIREKGAAAFEFNENAYYGKIKGTWTHTNTRRDKSDMFPQQELMDMLVSL